MAKATQPVSINGLEFDALISESRTLEATVPEYSIETGFSVSDSIILSPEKLEMTLFVTNTPVTWYRRHGASQNRVDSVVKQLEELYFAIVTSDATYTNMAIESMTISKSLEVGYAREIPISFKKIRITSAKTTTIPDSYGKSGATAASAGTASTSAASSGGSGTGSGSGSGGGTGSGSSSSSGSNGNSKSSILYNAASSIGLI